MKYLPKIIFTYLFIEEMKNTKKAKKPETIINKKDLFDYLDGFTFGEMSEIDSAICQYIEEQEGALYWSDCALAGELGNEYIQKRY